MNKHEQNLVGTLASWFFYLVSCDPDDFLPATLYHYTSAIGLLGIISSGKLWGTNYSYLNDSSELSYGREVARKVILEKLQAESNEHVKGFLKKISATFDATDDIDFYLTCFCKTPDLLSQWRGYGTTSSRFCIGFDPHALLYEEKAETLENFHGVVVYEQKSAAEESRAGDRQGLRNTHGRAH